MKDNQGTLHREVEESLTQAQATQFAGIVHDYYKTVDKGHGRLEIRQYWTISDAEYIQYLNADKAWSGLRSIGMVKSERRFGSQTTSETRYYIMSLAGSAQVFGRAVRGHWEIDNSVHWILDIAFQEDASRIQHPITVQRTSLSYGTWP